MSGRAGSLTFKGYAPKTCTINQQTICYAASIFDMLGINRVEFIGRTGKKHAWDNRNRPRMKRPLTVMKGEEVQVTLIPHSDHFIVIDDTQAFFEKYLCPL